MKKENLKWYVRKRDSSVHCSPTPVKDGVLVESPPSSKRNTWDWETNKWKWDKELQTSQAIYKINQELIRINKFFTLDSYILFPIEGILNDYVEELREYVKNLNEDSVMPTSPSELEDVNFYKL